MRGDREGRRKRGMKDWKEETEEKKEMGEDESKMGEDGKMYSKEKINIRMKNTVKKKLRK